MLISDLEHNVIADQYKLLKLIGKGKHAEVYRCVSIKTGKEYAVKVQSKESTSLLREASLLSAITKQSKIVADFGLPTCYCLQQNQKRIAIVEDLFGASLQNLRKKCNGMFKISTFLNLADQMVKRLQTLHEKQYIHRRITLKKWAIGVGKNEKKLYLLGFGRAKHYITSKHTGSAGKHIDYAQNKAILNDIQFASINNHLGVQPSRRDDLESMVYCWAKMLYGSLPWQDLADSQKILSKKIQQRGDVLFSNFPTQLKDIANYVRGLNFVETPDYDKIRNLLIDLQKEYNHEYTGSFEWQQKDKTLQPLSDEK